MQWKVSIGGKDRFVCLPDSIPDNVAFDATIDQRPVKLRWQRATRALFILDSKVGESWSSLNLRSKTVNKYAGESDLSVSTEFLPAGAKIPVALDATVALYIPGQESREGAAAKKPKLVRSQITGKVLKVMVKAGDSVNVGDVLVIIEAMKMENRVVATSAGMVESVKISVGDAVSTGAELIRFKQPS
jgi:biotin carboxyl carrier protein